MRLANPLCKPSVCADTMTQALDQHKLEFTIADVSTGPVSDIRNRMADLLPGWPDGQTLVVNDAGLGIPSKESDGLVHMIGVERLAQVRWGIQSSDGERWIYQKLRDGIPRFAPGAGTFCSRYITATITATYEGQTVQWKPVYLTGCNPPVREKFDVIASDRDIIASDRRVAYAILRIDEGLEVSPAVYALDPVMEQAAPYFWNADVYPYALLDAYPDSPKTRFGAVRDWLWMNASGNCTRPKTTCFEDGRVVIPSHDIPPAP